LDFDFKIEVIMLKVYDLGVDKFEVDSQIFFSWLYFFSQYFCIFLSEQLINWLVLYADHVLKLKSL